MRLRGVGSHVPDALFGQIGRDGWSMVVAQSRDDFFIDAQRTPHGEHFWVIQEALARQAKAVASSTAAMGLLAHDVYQSIF